MISNGEEDGFSREEAEQLLPQVKVTSLTCLRRGAHTYQLVSLDDRRFYVCVDSCGSVGLPQGPGQENYVRTNDSTKIPGFEHGW